MIKFNEDGKGRLFKEKGCGVKVFGDLCNDMNWT